jgi:site-specific DNA-methyltransferase (adenine-specific)/site-specific DNA-methyltransferase (cytosine-N4-specific)
MEITTDIYFGDAKEQLKLLTNDSVDLIVTSSPYADQRKNTYGGIHPDKYVSWFLPVSEQLLLMIRSMVDVNRALQALILNSTPTEQETL